MYNVCITHEYTRYTVLYNNPFYTVTGKGGEGEGGEELKQTFTNIPTLILLICPRTTVYALLIVIQRNMATLFSFQRYENLNRFGEHISENASRYSADDAGKETNVNINKKTLCPLLCRVTAPQSDTRQCRQVHGNIRVMKRVY